MTWRRCGHARIGRARGRGLRLRKIFFDRVLDPHRLEDLLRELEVRTRGAAPIAFVVAGIVALLTAYSYWRLTLRFPSQGGTVEFLNRAFGTGTVTGALNILLCLSYIILLSVYAYAFGAYGAKLLPVHDYDFWQHTLITGAVVVLALVNYFGAELAIRSENFFNVAKMLLLLLFVVVGLATPRPFTSIDSFSSVGYAVPMLILMISAVRSPMRRLYLRLT